MHNVYTQETCYNVLLASFSVFFWLPAKAPMRMEINNKSIEQLTASLFRKESPQWHIVAVIHSALYIRRSVGFPAAFFFSICLKSRANKI